MPPLLIEAAASPSLKTPGDGAAPAYELKFLVDEDRAQEVEAWARRRLVPDPHGDPALGGAYQTTTLYFDTPGLDVYRRTPSYRRRKYRVRRYDSAPWVFLERKSKWGDRVAKRRVLVPTAELPLLAGTVAPPEWPGHWFHGQLLPRDLLPACRIAYLRTAFVGACAEGPLRLTLDRQTRSAGAEGWRLDTFKGGRPFLTGRVILELKFRTALPALFKALVQELRLNPSPASKYRLCREAADA